MENKKDRVSQLWELLSGDEFERRLEVLAELTDVLFDTEADDREVIAAETIEVAVGEGRYDRAFQACARLTSLMVQESRHDDAIELIGTLLPFANLVADVDVAAVRWNLGAAFMGKKEFLCGAEELERTLELYNPDLVFPRAAVTQILARCLAEMGEYESAIQVFSDAAKLFAEAHEMGRVAVVKKEAGEFLVEICRYGSAREALTEASDIFNFMGLDQAERSCFVTLGRALVGCYEYEEARVLYDKVLEYKNSTQDLHDAAVALYYKTILSAKENGPRTVAQEFGMIATILRAADEQELAEDALTRMTPGAGGGDPWSDDFFYRKEVEADLKAAEGDDNSETQADSTVA